MAISHELSSEIAAALLAAKDKSPRELNDLKEIVFKIHSALEQSTEDERAAARSDLDASQRARPPDAKAKSA